jgi:hypothetical protein
MLTRVSQFPCSQQQKITEVAEALATQHGW